MVSKRLGSVLWACLFSTVGMLSHGTVAVLATDGVVVSDSPIQGQELIAVSHGAQPTAVGVVDGRPPQAVALWTIVDRRAQRPPTDAEGSDVLLVRVDHVALARIGEGGRLIIDLPGGDSVRGRVDRRRVRSAERYTVSGIIEGVRGGTFILAANSGAVAGNLLLGSAGIYRIRSGPPGLNIVERTNQARRLDCGTTSGHLTAVAHGVSGGATSGDCDDGSSIDLLVVYTHSAQQDAGGIAAMEAEIDVMVEYNDLAYENSLIDTRWNLVHTRKLEPGVEPFLLELTHPDDGVADGVHNLRDAYSADQVALVFSGHGGAANGLWNLEPESEALAFCVNGREATPIVLSHEIGHNMGCCHAFGQGGGCPPEGGLLFPFSNGHIFTGDSEMVWATVMAGGIALQHFSNPNIIFDGQPTGIPPGEGEIGADNVLTVNLSAFTVSNWRCHNSTCQDLDLPGDAPDCDGNGVPDGCDLALDPGLDVNGNGVPDSCEQLADFDGDGDVDLDDYSVFNECVSGPGVSPDPSPPISPRECLSVFDLDVDGDVDLDDFHLFVIVYNP